ncbi:MAG: alpha-L-fucosidase [Lentisphaerae bacterium]|jgi:alpha-L-fucosidase|nr:alpha-L-fucosidase [Lentisphaerota bacterium]MBT4821805.1 alpha-L-fucosidase [Lentisphaerota bacterium]MBT5611017.1 alpha-L-fucosidase [Lentisphaerota bacterium]MBT7059350.1 alpha-L-fucosidase [Lentisphaerota bacterium]MBT7845987.1 alpha-L-fucosidase [Lentisphaerota bacterium]
MRSSTHSEQVPAVSPSSDGPEARSLHEQWLAMNQSPEKRAAMAWFNEAKYGMFIHWGLYSQAAGSWKGVRIDDSPYPGPRVAEWLMSTFRIPRAEYAELARTFNPDTSFASAIARLAKDAGMTYVVITTKHHDGFALFDSASSDFDVVDATPYGADAIRELYDACLAEGLAFGAYYSHGNDWRDGTDGNYAEIKKANDALGVETRWQGKNLWDPSPNAYEEYLETKAYPQVAELLHLLPELRLIWFDGEGFITEEQSFLFYKLIYDINPDVIVNRRVGHNFGDYLDAGDNKIPSAFETLLKPWETCGTTNNSWGYKAYDNDWKSTQEILYYFIDIVSKGGNYLLNVGPDGNGHVPEPCSQRLREVGQWLKINGEAVYGTTRWKTPHEGADETPLGGTGHRAAKGFSRTFTPDDFWFTCKGNIVYAISLVPAEDSVRIRSLGKEAGTILDVRLLGSDRKVEWDQTATALELDLHGAATGENGFAVAVVLELAE